MAEEKIERESAFTVGICRVNPPLDPTATRGHQAMYRVLWRAGGKENAKRFRDRSKAVEFATETTLARGTNADALEIRERIKVAAVVDAYIASMPEGNYKQSRASLLRRFVVPAIGSLDVLQWTVADSKNVLRAMDAQGYKPSYRATLGQAMQGLVSYCRDRRWLKASDESPMRGVKYALTSTFQGESPLYVPRERIPEYADVEKLAQNATLPYMGLAWRFAARSGVRWGELIALQPHDFVLERRRVSVTKSYLDTQQGLALKAPKNGKARWSIYPESMVAELAEHLAWVKDRFGPRTTAFPTERGKVWRGSNHASRLWIPAAAATGWEPTPNEASAYTWSMHDLRHAAACWMLFDLKADGAQVAFWLGHHSPAFTMARYVGLRGDVEGKGFDLTAGW